ncbi:hypothetical protein ASE03_30810 [Kitasatospora sp. Root187]|nr:hypothetical protein ASC99_36365 [Kitasatospora sp. Root107]KRB66415.1 hypothetical protein ASE03_30810 [Kitasatospora sp. Root187]
MLMVAMDLTRAGVALTLPFVTQVWQIYVLIFLLQAASAAFTPTFQATIPEVLPAERAGRPVDRGGWSTPGGRPMRRMRPPWQ